MSAIAPRVVGGTLIALIGVIALVVVAVALALTYGVAHRSGRGAACFEVAVNTRDPTGNSLRTLLMSRPGAVWEYTFCGSRCTISIYVPGGGEDFGHWRYILAEATLYADDANATRIFPAAGRWQP
jgi:hypothetical protein